MTNSFVNIPDNFDPGMDFDELNPQIKFIAPFADLYLEDKKNYSKLMWICTFLCHPDEDKNKLYRLPMHKRKENIEKYFYKKVDWEHELLNKCLDEYPYACLSAIQLSLKEKKDFLVKRSKTLVVTPYNLETMAKIDAAISKSTKIYDDFDQLEEKYFNSKKGKSEVYGGRQETYTEEGKI